jgi:hypothetical protein
MKTRRATSGGGRPARHVGARLGRRTFVALLCGLAVAAVCGTSAAETPSVPPRLQAGLLAKVASFDRKFAARAGGRAKVLLVARANDADSLRTVTEMKSALAALDTIGGLPHDEQIVELADAAAIARTCKAGGIAVVYFGPGFGKQIASIRSALTSIDVLSVAAIADYVPEGIVLGFNLVSGNPKLLVHLTQARAQNVEFDSRVLKLMTIYE